MVNPVLVELVRGHRVESAHRGAIAVSGADGPPAYVLGDVTRPVFPRSAIKAMQCVPLIESGAADRYGFGAEEIALACASHSGTERHVAVAARMLERAGLHADALGCGSHEPLGAGAARELLRAGRAPTALHNNCSGKHAGMLATANHNGERLSGYLRLEHPVQARIASVLSDLTGVDVGLETPGIDGCSAPNWPISLSALARGFARLVSGEGLSSARQDVARRILDACWAEPELVAGPDRLDTRLMQKLPRLVYLKTGAEGVYCGGVPASGLGFALKVDDGAKRASELMVEALIARLVPQAQDLPLVIDQPNWRGLPAAQLRCSAAYVDSLARAPIERGTRTRPL